MKKIILGLFLFGFISAGHSQILLKEAKIDSRPESMQRLPVSNRLLIKISGNAAGEFEKDPLTFMKNIFDVEKFIADNRDGEFDAYRVFLKSRKGKLAANFDQSGNLISSSQIVKDAILPQNARLQIPIEYQDAVIVKSGYYATTRGWKIQRAYYKLKLREGNKSKRLRINKDSEHFELTGVL